MPLLMVVWQHFDDERAFALMPRDQALFLDDIQGASHGMPVMPELGTQIAVGRQLRTGRVMAGADSLDENVGDLPVISNAMLVTAHHAFHQSRFVLPDGFWQV